jgi:hypothetical protein
MTVLFRSLAVAIAIAGVIDPAVSWPRRQKPIVSVIEVSDSDRPLADEASAILQQHFTIARGPDAGAAAIVAVGDRVPDAVETGELPSFALVRRAPVAIDYADIPERATVGSQISVAFRGRVRQAGRSEARLRVNGLVVGREEITTKTPDERVARTIGFVATSPGLTRVRVELASGSSTASVDGAIDVRAARWRVLSYDPRPSWNATFVRRALEDDTRFAVASRVKTSRRVGVESGAAPAALDRGLDEFQAIVVGAPEALSAADVDRLEVFARRGGTVCLLLDTGEAGPYLELSGTSRLSEKRTPRPADVIAGDSRLGRLLASELAQPALGAAALTIAAADARPAVWRTPMGAGSVITSGALDAWRYRTAPEFARFWRTLIADAAERARPAIDLRLQPRVLAPGAPLRIAVSFGDAAAAVRERVHVASRVDGAKRSEPLRLWPAGPGHFRSEARAPGAPGAYRVHVEASAGEGPVSRSELEFIVARVPARVSQEPMLKAWSTAHGGSAFDTADIRGLDRALTDAIAPPTMDVRVFPMRSPWWLAPLTLALGVEWWRRRRHGLP